MTPRHFAWQAWHLVTSTCISHCKRGTLSHPPSFCVAGVALMALGALGLVLVARDAAALCVAGVAHSHIHLRFAWQAWHLWHWVARLGWFWSPVTPRHFAWQAWHLVTSTCISHCKRGTLSHPPSFCVAGVALMALGGALGLVLVARDAAALCVAGVALGDIDMRFTLQAWHTLTSTFVLRGRRGTYGTGWRAWAGFGRP